MLQKEVTLPPRKATSIRRKSAALPVPGQAGNKQPPRLSAAVMGRAFGPWELRNSRLEQWENFSFSPRQRQPAMQFTPRPPGASWGPNTGGSWPGEPGRGCWQRGQAARHRIDPVGFCGSGAGTRGLPGVPVTAGSCHGATSPPLQDGCRDGETDPQTQTSSSSQLLREKPRSTATSPFSPTTFTRDFGCANPQNLSSLEEPVLDSSSRHLHRQPWVRGVRAQGARTAAGGLPLLRSTAPRGPALASQPSEDAFSALITKPKKRSAR